VASYLQQLFAEITWWDVVGFSGQAIFASRFFVQWIASERRKTSVIPVSFWYLSIVGSLISLAYVLPTHRIPLILGYLFNCIPYLRNLMLIYARRSKEPAGVGLVCEHCGHVVEKEASA
jgi:lipid-A-disaccharide synthase-like uncharacterized protein